MHEFGLCEGVLDAVLKRAGGRSVSEVALRAGVRQRVQPESMQLAFSTVAAGTDAADATVSLETVPVDVHCRSCNADTTSMDPLPPCAACGSTDVDVTGGDELTLVSLTLRERASRA
jgi:hydrogenase nickel incorporation protein HypA/HybF